MENKEYVEGKSKARIVFFGFIGGCSIIGLSLIFYAEKKLATIYELAASTPYEAFSELNRLFIWYIILPFGIFFSLQALYLFRLSIKTLKAGTYPPPDVMMPFKTPVRRGFKARLLSAALLIGCILLFGTIVLGFMVWRELITMYL